MLGEFESFAEYHKRWTEIWHESGERSGRKYALQDGILIVLEARFEQVSKAVKDEVKLTFEFYTLIDWLRLAATTDSIETFSQIVLAQAIDH